jgi:hypothetical protein
MKRCDDPRLGRLDAGRVSGLGELSNIGQIRDGGSPMGSKPAALDGMDRGSG